MPRVSVQMTVSLPPELYRRAVRIAKKEIRSKSELVREALRDYISHEEKALEIRGELAKKLHEQGIRTLEDIEQLIDANRI